MTLAIPPGGRRRALRLPLSGPSAPAVYLITVVTAGRDCLFGHVDRQGELVLNEFGWMVQREWLRTGFVRPELELDAYVVMPNHLHAVLAVRPGLAVAAAPLPPAARVAEPAPAVARPAEQPMTVGAAAPRRVLAAAMAGFKAMCTVQINHRRGRPGAIVWQRGFVDSVVRSATELDAARRHIEENPLRWAASPRRGTTRGCAPVPPAP